MRLEFREPVSCDVLEDAADRALEALTHDDAAVVLGPVVGTNCAEGLLSIEYTAEAREPTDVHGTMKHALDLLTAAGFALSYRDMSASRILDEADTDVRELEPVC
jgi:hypothetical protein